MFVAGRHKKPACGRVPPKGYDKGKSPVKVSASMENQCFRAMTGNINPERRQEEFLPLPPSKSELWHGALWPSMVQDFHFSDPYRNQSFFFAVERRQTCNRHRLTKVAKVCTNLIHLWKR